MTRMKCNIIKSICKRSPNRLSGFFLIVVVSTCDHNFGYSYRYSDGDGNGDGNGNGNDSVGK